MMYILFAGSTAMPQPEIRSTHGEHILVGERLRLTCVVRVPRGDVVHMDWDYTSDEVSVSVVTLRDTCSIL